MSIKNSNDNIWNRTSDIPICSAAPQPLCYSGPRIYVGQIIKRNSKTKHGEVQCNGNLDKDTLTGRTLINYSFQKPNTPNTEDGEF